MAVVRIRLTRNGPRDLRRLPAVEDDMRRRAEKIAAQAGPGFVVKSSQGRNRARATVITGDADAMLAEAHGRALTNAIDAGR